MTGKPEDILRLNYCPRCGYDIAALPGKHRCPECGYAYGPDTVCLEIAHKPISGKRLLWLSILVLAALSLGFVLLRFSGRPMLFQLAYFFFMLIWAAYVAVQRYRFSKLNLPYVRLIITPRGYRQARGLRMGREKPWHPMHSVRFSDNGSSYGIELISRDPKDLGLPKLWVPLLINAEVASALRTRIQNHISNLKTESAGG